MKLSARTEYACLAMLHLAANYDATEPVQLRRIAGEHGIPSPFLVQILQQLKAVGLVSSVRGASGGYRLMRPPREISLLDVVEVMEGGGRPETSAAKQSPLVEALSALCTELCDAQRERLAAVTLADLVEQVSADREPMWYI